MGATGISLLQLGYTSEHAYKMACAEAECTYGHQDGYSGAINSSRGFIATKLPNIDSKKLIPKKQSKDRVSEGDFRDEFIKIAKKYEDEIIEKYDKFEGVACVDLGIAEYHTIKIAKKEASKRKCDLYIIENNWNKIIERNSNLEFLKKEAEIKIKQIPQSLTIYGILKNSDKVKVTEYKVEVKSTRRMPTKGLFKELHLYWFCGLVSC